MNIGYYLLAVIVSIIFGIWLRQAAADELKSGRKWIKAGLVLGIVGAVIFVFVGEPIAALTCMVAAIIAGISLKSRR